MNSRDDPYYLLSDVYDAGWSDYDDYIYQLIRSVEEESGRIFHRICDAACGTGMLMHTLSVDTYERKLSGFDISPRMLHHATEKLPAAPLVQGDLRDGIPFEGPFDLTLCVYDALNYVFVDGEMEQFFSSARRHATPDGVLLFDVNTRQLYRRRDGEVTPRLIDGVAFRQRLTYDPGPPERGITEFDFPNGRETHIQRPWEVDEVEELLTRTGWNIADTLDVIDEYDDLPSGKVVIIAVS